MDFDLYHLHCSHSKRKSLTSQNGQKDRLRQPVTVSMYIWNLSWILQSSCQIWNDSVGFCYSPRKIGAHKQMTHNENLAVYTGPTLMWCFSTGQVLGLAGFNNSHSFKASKLSHFLFSILPHTPRVQFYRESFIDIARLSQHSDCERKTQLSDKCTVEIEVLLNSIVVLR